MGDEPDLTKMVFRVDARRANTLRIEKTVAYHTSRGLPVRELSDRCRRTLDRAARYDLDHWLAEQRAWYDAFWAASDVEVASDDRTTTRSSRRSGSTSSRSRRPAGAPTGTASRRRG